MKKALFMTAIVVLVLAAACSFYKDKPKMNYYHGQNVPQGFIKIIRASAEEVEFEVRVSFSQRQMYHLILEGNDPLAEGWFPTILGGQEYYTVKMKPGKGRVFEVGKAYRLCIGYENPEQIQLTSSNYSCKAEFEFVFQNK